MLLLSSSVCPVGQTQASFAAFGILSPEQLSEVTQAPDEFFVCPVGHSQVLLLSSSVCPVGQTQASLAAFGILSPAQLIEVTQAPDEFFVCPDGQTHAELSPFGVIPLGHASHDVFPAFGTMFPVHAVHAFPPMLTSLPVHAVHEVPPSDSCPSGQIHAELSPFGTMLPVHAVHAFPPMLTSLPVHAVHEVLPLDVGSCPSGQTQLPAEFIWSPGHSQMSSLKFAASPLFQVVPEGHPLLSEPLFPLPKLLHKFAGLVILQRSLAASSALLLELPAPAKWLSAGFAPRANDVAMRAC